jgi:hypothetical protein
LDFGLGIEIAGVNAQRFGRLLNPKSKIKNPKYKEHEERYGFQNAADDIWLNFFG